MMQPKYSYSNHATLLTNLNIFPGPYEMYCWPWRGWECRHGPRYILLSMGYFHVCYSGETQFRSHYITIYLYYRLWFSSCHINCGKVWREDSWLHLELTEKVRYKICFWVDRRNYLVTLQVMMSEDALYDDGVVMEAVIEKFVKYFKSIFHHNSWYFASFIFCEYYC